MKAISAALAAATATAIVVSSSFAIAAIPDPATNVITVCYKKSSGELRVIDKEAKGTKGACKIGSENELSFNQQGRQGAAGTAGTNGIAGADGTDADKCSAYPRRLNDLSDCDLRFVNYANMNLFGANLSRANLTGAKLTGAELSGANLTGANLTNAKLIDANLTGVVSGGIVGVPISLPAGWTLVGGVLVAPGADLTGP